MGKPVRMADIAERLGISVVSVSKALAGKPGVSEEMRARVVALARQMGYEGTKLHCELGGTGNIGVLVSDRFFSENAFYANLYRALALESGSRGFGCMIEIVSLEAERERALPSLLTGHRADGLIFMGCFDEGYLRAVSAGGVPCLLLDFRIPGAAWDCVVSDNQDGGYSLTRHLLDRGIREIGFVGSVLATSSIMDRFLGFQQALRTAGVPWREDWLLEDRDGDGSFLPLRLPAQLPQAFLCSCDEAAFYLVQTLRDAGRRVPENVAVCGYDDHRFATLAAPHLTTYHVETGRMAEAAVERLTERLRQADAPPVIQIIPGRLVVRESSGGPV